MPFAHPAVLYQNVDTVPSMLKEDSKRGLSGYGLTAGRDVARLTALQVHSLDLVQIDQWLCHLHRYYELLPTR